MPRPLLPFGIAGLLIVAAFLLGQGAPHALSLGLPRPPAFGGSPPASSRPSAAVEASRDGSLTLTAHLSDPVLAQGDQRDEYLLLDVVGAAAPSQAPRRVPMNIAVVLDCSGSMSGEKLQNSRRASHELVDRLTEQDRLAFITFGSTVQTLVPSSPANDTARAEMHRAIDTIGDMGSTNISGGLQAGLSEVRTHAGQFPVNRVILISDGHANEGITSKEGLVAISQGARQAGVSVTSFGVGVDYDEDLMEQLAENGGGNYSFLRTGGDLEAVFTRELQQLATQVASNPRLTLQAAPGVRVTEVYGYASETDASGRTLVQLYDVSAGAHFRVLVRLTAPAQAPGNLHMAEVRLDYINLLHDRAAAQAQASLVASVSADPTLAAAQRDPAIYSQVIVGNAALASKSVATLYSQGQVAEAQRQLEEARSSLGRSAAELGVPGVQGDIDRMLPRGPLPSSPSSEEGRVRAVSQHRNIIDFASASTAS